MAYSLHTCFESVPCPFCYSVIHSSRHVMIGNMVESEDPLIYIYIITKYLFFIFFPCVSDISILMFSASILPPFFYISLQRYFYVHISRRTDTRPNTLLTVQVRHADAHGPPVGLELLDLGELHDRLADVPQALGREIRAGDVLNEGRQVDAGVLLGVAVCSCDSVHVSAVIIEWECVGDSGWVSTYARSGSHQPSSRLHSLVSSVR